MTVTLNSPARIATLVGALVLTGLAAVVFLVGRSALGDGSSAATNPAPVTHTTPRTTPKPSGARPQHTRSRTPASRAAFPRGDHALRHSRIVVISISIPGAPVDAIVRSEARAGAHAPRGLRRIAQPETAVALVARQACSRIQPSSS